jgi:hypothetical protein
LEYLSHALNLVKIAAFFALFEARFEQLLSDAQPSAAGTVMFLQYITVMTQYERFSYITLLASLFYNSTTSKLKLCNKIFIFYNIIHNFVFVFYSLVWYMFLNLIVELIIDFILQIIRSGREHQQ